MTALVLIVIETNKNLHKKFLIQMINLALHILDINLLQDKLVTRSTLKGNAPNSTVTGSTCYEFFQVTVCPMLCACFLIFSNLPNFCKQKNLQIWPLISFPNQKANMKFGYNKIIVTGHDSKYKLKFFKFFD